MSCLWHRRFLFSTQQTICAIEPTRGNRPGEGAARSVKLVTHQSLCLPTPHLRSDPPAGSPAAKQANNLRRQEVTLFIRMSSGCASICAWTPRTTPRPASGSSSAHWPTPRASPSSAPETPRAAPELSRGPMGHPSRRPLRGHPLLGPVMSSSRPRRNPDAEPTPRPCSSCSARR
ncbi:hypothetical protein XA26_47410 [Mycolicibacterium fortuitum]|uniref:Uncharacterized protein n=1 Tax=Mycolicibacterium fortuitum TaxID=1766 RepID=A0A0N9XIB7_MYCFO|nr:hypothetical protein XA26_47410 [Mycolicibacterium fortuitum]